MSRNEQLLRRLIVLLVFVVLCFLSMRVLYVLLQGTPETTRIPADSSSSEEREHFKQENFKYGSIGSDNLRGGLPYWIMAVLPEVFKDQDELKGEGYKAFGLLVEEGKDRPVGFSKRRIGTRRFGVDMVGMNCAACHAGSLQTGRGKTDVIAGMPSPTVDVERFFLFLFKTAKDSRFADDTIIDAIQKKMKQQNQDMGVIHRWLYRGLIRLYRWEIGKLEQKFCFLHEVVTEHCGKKLPGRAGPGRIDTWAPYKVLTFQSWPAWLDFLPHLSPPWLDYPDMDINGPGFADIPSLWNLEQRLGRGLHWDGNTSLLGESSVIAAVGSGAAPITLDQENVSRIGLWLRTLHPPKYDEYAPQGYKIDATLSGIGSGIYVKHCSACHHPLEPRFGLVEPIENIGTDGYRLTAFTEQLAIKLNKVGRGYNWRLRKLTKTHGYTNVPLDGIWLRAPYLHNGSVPTLDDLLKPPDDRPEFFYRGNMAYDWQKVGFISDSYDQKFFPYDTYSPGNGNGGHLAGTKLQDREKQALLEYLKTL